MPTIVYRELGEFIHLLNYTTGEVMSCPKEDGRYLLMNMGRLPSLGLKDENLSFFVAEEEEPNAQACIANLVVAGEQYQFPAIVILELNRSCVLGCNSCLVESECPHSTNQDFVEKFEKERFEKILDDLVTMGAFVLVIAGGEPFLNPRLQEILEMAVDRGFLVEILSNLQVFPDWFLAKSPYERLVGGIQSTVYSTDADIHDAITGIPGSLDKTLTTLQRIKNAGYHVEVVTPLITLNFDCRNETEAYFQELGIPHLFIWPVTGDIYVENKGRVAAEISEDQFVTFCDERPRYMDYIGWSGLSQEMNSIGYSSLAISYEGGVYLCLDCPHAFGSLETEGVQDIYDSLQMSEARERLVINVPLEMRLVNFCIAGKTLSAVRPARKDREDYGHEGEPPLAV